MLPSSNRSQPTAVHDLLVHGHLDHLGQDVAVAKIRFRVLRQLSRFFGDALDEVGFIFEEAL